MRLHSFVASISVVLAGLLATPPAAAKVSTSIVLCFDPGDSTVSSRVAAEAAGLVSRSRGLGPVVALFFVTLAEEPLETDGTSDKRMKELAAYLASKGFKSEFNDFRRIKAAPSDTGCSDAKVAVEIEALFPHDGYN
jgi:hypothetical protein